LSRFENYTPSPLVVFKITFLSPGACLREAASAKAGERGRVRGKEM